MELDLWSFICTIFITIMPHHHPAHSPKVASIAVKDKRVKTVDYLLQILSVPSGLAVLYKSTQAQRTKKFVQSQQPPYIQLLAYGALPLVLNTYPGFQVV
jgi:hypothetical protein